MLAARLRGLGTSWTTVHLYFEKEAAEVLSIPYEKVTQAALIPVAYTLGTDFNRFLACRWIRYCTGIGGEPFFFT